MCLKFTVSHGHTFLLCALAYYGNGETSGLFALFSPGSNKCQLRRQLLRAKLSYAEY